MCEDKTLSKLTQLPLFFPCILKEGRYLELNRLYEKSFFIVLVCFLIHEHKCNTNLFDSTNLEIVKHDSGFMDLVLANFEWSLGFLCSSAPRDGKQSCSLQCPSVTKSCPSSQMVKNTRKDLFPEEWLIGEYKRILTFLS